MLSVFGQQVDLDSTGNGLLSGTYNFREALWITEVQATNDLNEAAAQWGTITFDGRGNYTMSVNEYSSRTNSVRTYVRPGTYTIGASGAGLIRRVSDDGDIIYGAVSNGIFIGSATESGFNNLFIAARQPTAAVTTASFNQRYSLAYLNLPATSMTQVRDASFQINPNGSGSLGTVSVTGYSAGNYTAASQTISNASYSFAAGVGTLNLGAKNSTDLVSGSHQLFVSADGQFVFGGQTNGWDMFVGVRTPTSQPTYSGLYYQAGMDVQRSALPSGNAVLGSYYGAANIISSSKNVLGHQRVQTAPDAPYEYTYSDFYTLSATGTHDDFLGLLNFVSSDGSVRVGFGRVDYLGLNVAIKAPTLSGTGMYLNPTGVVNAASYSPFTTGIAPGELITLFGTGLATGDFVDVTFPFTLGGVSVRINGRNAPVYVVSPTQISAIVPYETQEGVAEIQVVRGATTSNRVTMYVNRTAPGVFAVPPTGIGYAAALHPDYTLVTPANPARIGETIAVYLTGLGLTDPQISNGAAGPVSPLAKAVETIDVSLANRRAKVVYSGLAPLLRGLYQLNFEVPANVPAGDQYLDIGGPDTLNSQILLPVGGPRSAAAEGPQRGRPGPDYNSAPRTRNGFDPAATASSSSPSKER